MSRMPKTKKTANAEPKKPGSISNVPGADYKDQDHPHKSFRKAWKDTIKEARYASQNASVYKTNALLWKRALAFLLDMAFLSITLLAPFSRIIKGLVPSGSSADIYESLLSSPSYSTAIYATMGFAAMITVMYFTLFEYGLSQTPGKMLAGIYVEGDKGRPGLWQSFFRNIVLIPFFPFIILWVLDPIYLLWKNHRLCEIITKTRTMQFVYYRHESYQG